MSDTNSTSIRLFNVLNWRKSFAPHIMSRAYKCLVEDLKPEFKPGKQKIPLSISGRVIDSEMKYDAGIVHFPGVGNAVLTRDCMRCACAEFSREGTCPHVAAILMQYEKYNGVVTIEENEEQYNARIKEQQSKRILENIERERAVTSQINRLSDEFISSHGGTAVRFGELLRQMVTFPFCESRSKDILFRRAMKLKKCGYESSALHDPGIRAEVAYDDMFGSSHEFVVQASSSLITWSNGQGQTDQEAVPVEVPYPAFRWDGKRTFVNEYQLACIDLLWTWCCEHPFEALAAKIRGNAFVEALSGAFETDALSEKLKNDELYNLTFAEEGGRLPIVQLSPRLILSRGEDSQNAQQLSLTLDLLRENAQPSAVSDLMGLLDAYDQKKAYRINKFSSLDFSQHELDAKSQGYLDIVREHCSRIRDFIGTEEKPSNLLNKFYYDVGRRANPRLPQAADTDSIPLKGLLLKAFYRQAEGSFVRIEDTTSSCGRTKVFVGGDDDSLKVELKVSKAGPENETVQLSGYLPLELSGAFETVYVLTRDALIEVDQSSFSPVRQLVSAVRSVGDFDISVPKESLDSFFSGIYPVLRKKDCFSLSSEIDEEWMKEHLAPQGAVTFFADVKKITDTKIIIRVKVTVKYDGFSHSLGDGKVPEVPADGRIPNQIAEHAIISNIERSGGIREKDGWRWELDRDSGLNEFLTKTVARLELFGLVMGTEEFARLKRRGGFTLDFDVLQNGKLLDLKLTSAEVDKFELLRIFDEYSKGKKWYRLTSGEFIELSDNPAIANAVKLLEKLDVLPADVIAENAKIPVFRALYLDKIMESRDGLMVTRDESFIRLVDRFANISAADFALPKSLEGIMREYQKFGFKWVKTLLYSGFGGILADDMGLGKTLQMIAVILSEIEERKKEGRRYLALVICPSSLVLQWVQEFRRFAPSVRVIPMIGIVSQREVVREEMDHVDVVVASYEILLKDVVHLRDRTFDLMIIDEAQKIKNFRSQTAKACKVVKADGKMALTGTPIENKLSELWSIFDFVMPGYLYTQQHFASRYEAPIAVWQDEDVTRALKNMVSPFILRRRKADVLKDLPEKTEDVVYAGLEGEQQKLYDAQLLKIKADLRKEIGIGDFNKEKIRILAELTRMRQICCHPKLLFDNYTKNSAKLDMCMELVETAMDGGHRMLLFSQFTSMLAIISKELDDRHISHYILTGETPKEVRIAMVEKFNRDTTPVFLISLKAGGVGLNLTGADTVIHYDPWWNVAAQNQATDRAYRIGQTRNVTVYKLILKDTVEDRLLTLQQTKKDLADAILEGEQKSIMKLTREELLELLS